MDFYFANEDALLEFLREHVKLETEKEYGYYGDVSLQAKVMFNGKEIHSASEYHHDSHCSGCKCYDD